MLKIYPEHALTTLHAQNMTNNGKYNGHGNINRANPNSKTVTPSVDPAAWYSDFTDLISANSGTLVHLSDFASLSALSEGTEITQVNDLSGNDFHLFKEPAGNPSPTKATRNGMPAIRFEAGDAEFERTLDSVRNWVGGVATIVLRVEHDLYTGVKWNYCATYHLSTHSSQQWFAVAFWDKPRYKLANTHRAVNVSSHTGLHSVICDYAGDGNWTRMHVNGANAGTSNQWQPSQADTISFGTDSHGGWVSFFAVIEGYELASDTTDRTTVENALLNWSY